MFKETLDGVEMRCVNDRDVCTKYSTQIQMQVQTAQDPGFLKVTEVPGLIDKSVDF